MSDKVTFEIEYIGECEILQLKSVQMLKSFSSLNGYLLALGAEDEYRDLLREMRKVINGKINDELNILIDKKIKQK